MRGGEPGHAKDNWKVWCLDKAQLECFLMTLKGNNFEEDGLVGNWTWQKRKL